MASGKTTPRLDDHVGAELETSRVYLFSRCRSYLEQIQLNIIKTIQLIKLIIIIQLIVAIIVVVVVVVLLLLLLLIIIIIMLMIRTQILILIPSYD